SHARWWPKRASSTSVPTWPGSGAVARSSCTSSFRAASRRARWSRGTSCATASANASAAIRSSAGSPSPSPPTWGGPSSPVQRRTAWAMKRKGRQCRPFRHPTAGSVPAQALQCIGHGAVERRGLLLRCPGGIATATTPITATRAAAVVAVATTRIARTGLAWLVAHAAGQGDALSRHVHLQHLHLDDVAGLDHVARILDVALAQRGDMDQAVLVHADVDEGAERCNVADHAFQHHARLEVLDVLHALGELRRLELRTRIAARLLQLLEDVAHGRHAELLVGELLGLERAQEGTVADDLLHLLAAAGEDAL